MQSINKSVMGLLQRGGCDQVTGGSCHNIPKNL